MVEGVVHALLYLVEQTFQYNVYVFVYVCGCGPYRNMLSLNNIIFAMSTSFQMNFFIDAINRIYPSVECALDGDCFCSCYISSSCSGCPPTCYMRNTNTRNLETLTNIHNKTYLYLWITWGSFADLRRKAIFGMRAKVLLLKLNSAASAIYILIPKHILQHTKTSDAK